jgi:predicted  nucleic acid-binding Zn-ribbon protein
VSSDLVLNLLFQIGFKIQKLNCASCLPVWGHIEIIQLNGNPAFLVQSNLRREIAWHSSRAYRQLNRGGGKEMVKLRSVFIFILLLAVAAMGVACSGNESPSQMAGAKDEGQPAAMEQGDKAASAMEQESQSASEMAQSAEQSAEMPKSVEITGMVEQGDNGVVIVTDLGKYSVAGQDLSSMVGKTVKVTGALEESAGQYTINVESVEESH